ncbi:MAG: GNAT family N-acetyltransferase [Acidobacteria bacterium]|nr:GNAT family N-acetyltransferase [Acidobacteriota bacterium]
MTDWAMRDGTADEASDVFCDAFAGYPVMEFVAGPASPAEHQERLIRLFVMGRAMRGHPMRVIEMQGTPVAAMTLTPPDGSLPEPTDENLAALGALTTTTWEEAGTAARACYDAFVEAANAVDAPLPNWHVNMVGVVGAHQGTGLARALLEDAHARSAADPNSRGVSLTTELPANVAFYRHLGYEVVGEQTAGELTTWGFFRPDA